MLLFSLVQRRLRLVDGLLPMFALFLPGGLFPRPLAIAALRRTRRSRWSGSLAVPAGLLRGSRRSCVPCVHRPRKAAFLDLSL
jgi:hypothetical protein